MSRTARFIKNSSTSAILQIATMIAGLITPRFMLKYYGSEVNGIVTSISQFIAYFNLVEAGISGAAVYALYKPLSEKNQYEINSVLSAARKFYSQSGYIFTSLVIGMAILYPTVVKACSVSPFSTGLLVLILGVNGALEFFTLAKYRALLTADQKIYVISLASIVNILINTIVVVVLSLLRLNIVLLRLVALLSVFSRSIILRAYVKRNYYGLDYHAKPNVQALDKRWDALYLQVLGATQSGMPVILATAFTSLKWVSVFSIFNMIASALQSIMGIFTHGLFASFGGLIASGATNTLKRAYSEFEFVYYKLITVVYSVAMVTIMPFIALYTKGVTDINYNVPEIGFLILCNGLLYNMKTPQGMLVISAGLYRETRTQSTIQAAIIIVAGIILAPLMGLSGILLASCLSNMYRVIDLVVFIPKTVTKLPIKSTIFRLIFVVIEMTVIVLFLRMFSIEPTSLVHWLFFAAIAVAVSTTVVITTSLLFEVRVFRSVLNRIKITIKRRN